MLCLVCVWQFCMYLMYLEYGIVHTTAYRTHKLDTFILVLTFSLSLSPINAHRTRCTHTHRCAKRKQFSFTAHTSCAMERATRSTGSHTAAAIYPFTIYKHTHTQTSTQLEHTHSQPHQEHSVELQTNDTALKKTAHTEEEKKLKGLQNECVRWKRRETAATRPAEAPKCETRTEKNKRKAEKME